MIDSIIASVGAMPSPHGAEPSGGGLQIQLWQLINFVGAPLLAVMFARPVIDDLRAWRASGKDESEVR